MLLNTVRKSLKGPEKNLVCSIKNSCEVINMLKSRGFRAASLSTYDFSTLYTTLLHNLIKDKLVDFIERIVQREGSLYISCNDRYVFPPLMQLVIIIHSLLIKCVKLSPFSLTIFIIEMGLNYIDKL